MMILLQILFSLNFSIAYGATSLNLSPLTDLAGAPAKLSSTKPRTLVVFWASWCDDCRSKLKKELVEFNALPDLQVITINADKEADRARAYVKKESLQVPVFLDPDKKVRKELGVFAVPHWAIIKTPKDNQLGAIEVITSSPAFELEDVRKAIATK